MQSSLAKSIQIIQESIELMPKCPGVYRMISAENKVLYVGKAKNLPKRVASYSKLDALPNRLRRMVSQIERIETTVTNTEAEALLLEASLIKSLKPIYNIALRDDKTFPYILIEDSLGYPRLTKFRGRLDKNRGSYYGPFASAGAVNMAIAELQKLFLVRPCSDAFFKARQRPCLQYQIKRCSAPCVELITQEEYSLAIKDIKDFLSGKSNIIQDKLAHQMQMHSQNMEYEKAAALRDRLKLLSQIQSKNMFQNFGVKDVDVFALYVDKSQLTALEVFFIRAGKSYGSKVYFNKLDDILTPETLMETLLGQFYQRNPAPEEILVNVELSNAKLLEQALTLLNDNKAKILFPKTGQKKELIDFALHNAKEHLSQELHKQIKNKNILNAVAKLFDVPKEINKIEVYDNSHIQGSDKIGCKIAIGAEGFIKKHYRKYKINDTSAGDDFAMMREVFRRRFAKVNDDNFPELVIIDGGKGQLSAALEAIKEYNILDVVFVAMSKGPNRNAGREIFHQSNKAPFQLPQGDPILLYLQNIRDEVHRYAISAHRSMRDKNIRKSVIENIPGIGSYRKRRLLNYFGSFEEIKKASVDDLKRVSGISQKSALSILDYFAKKSN